jgi:hypothetical protein
LRVIFVSDGRAEEREQSITQELIHVPTLALHGRRKLREQIALQRNDLLRIEPFA